MKKELHFLKLQPVLDCEESRYLLVKTKNMKITDKLPDDIDPDKMDGTYFGPLEVGKVYADYLFQRIYNHLYGTNNIDIFVKMGDE